jgi:predicted GIY-YIG superfamily endonuclease
MTDAPEIIPTPAPAAAPAPFTVYILRCVDGTYYVGFAEDVPARLSMHRSGRASTYTARRLPVAVVYTEGQADRNTAILRARELKMWSRERKTALVTGDTEALNRFNRPPQPTAPMPDERPPQADAPRPFGERPQPDGPPPPRPTAPFQRSEGSRPIRPPFRRS